ncbi:MAG: NADH-quinone oxidoreductase subunit NuoK [Candidatus Desulfatibia sp.]|uniref:NADH-quinone oxidoreductase subunit NuoK n=1 Tax=Candidatus Desulfatibia sp. TaxID=3101189 RepID=UPI002F2CADBF
MDYFLGVSAILFSIGAFGVITQKNAIKVLMCIEIMLNTATLNLVAFSANMADISGQLIVIFAIAVGAAEIAIGLAILLLIFNKHGSIDLSEIGTLRRR